jgi:hypothetical protein
MNSCANCNCDMEDERTFTDYCPDCYKGLDMGGNNDDYEMC